MLQRPSLPNKDLPAFSYSTALFLILSKTNSSFIKKTVLAKLILYSLLTQFYLHPRKKGEENIDSIMELILFSLERITRKFLKNIFLFYWSAANQRLDFTVTGTVPTATPQSYVTETFTLIVLSAVKAIPLFSQINSPVVSSTLAPLAASSSDTSNLTA